MSQRAATITSLPVAFEVVKAMQADGLEWGEGFRPLGRQALQEIIEDQMAGAVDRYLDQIEVDDPADRRNGYYRRYLLTELGDIELDVPRTRRYSPVEVIRAYARRTPEIDRFFDRQQPGPAPSGPGAIMRFTGGQNYAGITVLLIGIWAVITGVLEIFAAVRLHRAHGEWLLGLNGALSVLFGLLLFALPAMGELTLIWLIGGYSIFFGVLMLALACRLRGRRGAPA